VERFHRLAKQAFSKRSGLKYLLHVPGGHFAAQVACSFLYKNSGIRKALQNAFGDETKLFGDTTHDADTKKIILVATSEEEQKPFLLTNYNREWRVNDDGSNMS
jgi:hypothetical protein